MRRLGAAAISLLIHLLLIAGVTSLLLGTIVVGSHLVIWRGLDFPVDSRRGLALLAGGVALVVAGVLAYRSARRLL